MKPGHLSNGYVRDNIENEHDHQAFEKNGMSSPSEGEKNQNDGEGNDSDRPPRSASMSTLCWVVLCSSMLVAMLQAALDSTITANLQPTIIETFGEIAKFPWINVTYSLGLGGSCLFWYSDFTLQSKNG